MQSDWVHHTDDSRLCREAQTCDSDVTDYYYYGYKEKRGGKEAIDYYYTDDGQKRDHIRDNDKRHEARSPHCLRLEEID